MLRNKSSSGMMSSPKNPTTSISSILGSPRFLNGILTKHFPEAENVVVMSPTSILDTKNSSISANPFGHDKNLSKSQIPSPNKLDSEAIGLALIDSIKDDYDDDDDDKDGINFSKPISRMFLFGSKLKVQIPTTLLPSSSISPVESPRSPADFGIKTREKDSQLMSPFTSKEKDNTHVFTRQLSLKEMEMSEDYTCVITHGPNPKTTHIYDNCIVESCCGDLNLADNKKRDCDFEGNFSVSSPSVVDFLSCCHSCKTSLGDGKDVYMYRGDKAFCSDECRCQEMLFEGIKNPEMDNSF